MNFQEVTFFCVAVISFLLYMVWRRKPKQPTALNMTKKATGAHPDLKRIEGARWVDMEILKDKEPDDSPSEKSPSNWAHPVVLIHGKYVDAYSVINLSPGDTKEQVHKRVEELLKGSKSKGMSSSKIEQIRQAYQAIINVKTS